MRDKLNPMLDFLYKGSSLHYGPHSDKKCLMYKAITKRYSRWSGVGYRMADEISIDQFPIKSVTTFKKNK